MIGYAYFEYLSVGDGELFTMIALPEESGRYPTVVCRSPYVRGAVGRSEEELTQEFLRSHAAFLERGYAVVFQHCKGCGRSTGDFVPYVHEREDGLVLRSWIRSRDFYNGELYLLGGSYTASLHYATSPFEEDVRAAVFEAQDSERYRLWYRNGQMRKGHANWHFGLYKCNSLEGKRYSMRSFAELPLDGLSERAFGERAEDFEGMLRAARPSHEFWSTRRGGCDARDAVARANIPILLTTGYNDFYVGGVFKMWQEMDSETKKQSALLVSPYNHSDGYDGGLCFPSGRRSEQFGARYQLDWFDHVRKGTPISFDKGVITYYRTFEDKWDSDFYKKPIGLVKMGLGEGRATFDYDPKSPTAFECEGRLACEECDGKRYIRVCTKPLDRDAFVKGQMQAVLSVSSSCADTSFYLRVSIKKEDCTYVLRHDVSSLSYQLESYTENETVKLNFCFDEYAFLLKKGECLQVDIASTDDNTYVSHTNNPGEYYLQTDTTVATNTVHLDDSYLLIPVEI